MDISEILENKRSAILDIAARHGALNIRVFGSVSRSEAGPESDVDFLIELEPGRTLLDHAALYLELKQLLGCEVDVVTEKGLRPRIRDRVLKEAISI
ncbi:MAG: nucleotidyltransferase [Candidatus Solincola sediminis]|nr:MAG: nucleotidyltransferase [Candidatus Solincola sediminis]